MREIEHINDLNWLASTSSFAPRERASLTPPRQSSNHRAAIVFLMISSLCLAIAAG
jgi:hypothetical protein